LRKNESDYTRCVSALMAPELQREVSRLTLILWLDTIQSPRQLTKFAGSHHSRKSNQIVDCVYACAHSGAFYIESTVHFLV
jgi:uncharacterized protein YlbG (UPF0298 family)